METYVMPEDKTIFCVTAKSFPYEIKQSFAELINKLPSTEGRSFFGISYEDRDGTFVYKAAVQEFFEGEGNKLGCEEFIMTKGKYLTETVKNWKKDETQIGVAFRKITSTDFDITFPCVERYQGDEVMCMVKLF